MRLGIDFGTTRTVVAAAERGNYPVLSFQAENGDAQQWYPSVIASDGHECCYGLEAQLRQGIPGWHVLRSFKRLLAEASPQSRITLGQLSVPALDLLASYLLHLREAILKCSNLELAPDEPLEALVAVPANSNSNQRFLTMEAFRRAGFHVLALINEPSAAGIEYAHSYRAKAGTARQEHVVVYDLGGGTFDTSVVRMFDRAHEVLSNEGIALLGGDDFDELLLELALERAGIDSITAEERRILLEECRERKEGLHPNSRKIAVDLGRAVAGQGEVIVTAAEFYERCAPLVENTILAVERTVIRVSGGVEAEWKSVAALYLVGGASDLPVVSRMLRQQYGKRVRRSAYPFAATAIGLAIAADTEAGYALRERFTRHFGVWREAESGERIIFDPVFLKDTLLPEPGDPPLVVRRSYRPAHNIGHLRYLECGGLTADGQPSGDITPWQEIRYPFDPALSNTADLGKIPVIRCRDTDMGLVEETYSCDASGMIEVSIRNHATGEHRTFHIRARSGILPTTGS